MTGKSVADQRPIQARDDFARQATKNAFGHRYYVDPRDANFRDRLPPNWRRLGDIAGQVLIKMTNRMAIENAISKDGDAT